MKVLVVCCDVRALESFPNERRFSVFHGFFRCYGLKLKEKRNFITPSACELIRLTAASSCSEAMWKEISTFMNPCPGATSSRTPFSRARTRQMTLRWLRLWLCGLCFQCESSEAAAVCKGCCLCGVMNAPDSCPDSSCIPQQDPPRSSSALPPLIHVCHPITVAAAASRALRPSHLFISGAS